METKLERISQLSRENPDMVFTSIGHLMNRELLKKCHGEMDKDKAVGIDAEENRHRGGKGKPETFTFLGFTHYCSKSKNGKFRVKRKTSRKKYTKKCKEMNRKIRSMMTWKLRDIMKSVNQILAGYFRYYGITDNINSIGRFWYEVEKSLFYWLNHRSQKRSYTWEEYREMQKVYPLEPAKIYVSIYDS